MDNLLLGCFAAQKLFGRDVGNAQQVSQLFHTILGKFPADKVIRALETWLEDSQEFPTPADITGLIKRNGRPPLTKERYIAIQKKHPEDRTDADWKYLQDYENEQDAGWNDFEEEPHDQESYSALQRDNERIRTENIELQKENDRLAAVIADLKTGQGIPKPLEPTAEQKVRNTIDYLESVGAPHSDIEKFAEENGVTI